MHRIFFRAALIVAGAGTASFTTAAEPATWRPAGPWQLDQQPDQCTLLRPFAAGDQRLVMQVQPNLYSTTHSFKLASETALAGSREGMIAFTLGESAPHKYYAMLEATADGRQRVLRWTTEKALSFAELVAGDQMVRIDAAAGFNGMIHWQGAKKAFAALRACQDQVASAKGEDAAARRAYKRDLEPLGNPGRWVTNDDYPTKARTKMLEGDTGFRLTVDKMGAITHCEIISSSGFPILDERTCELLKMRAKFAPSLDASGEPVADTYSNRVRWQLPR
ncbi:energy transducer TonB [Sphingopyxis panaciterrae]